MGKSCKEIAETLIDCIKNSQCVKNGGDVRSCMKTPQGNDEVQMGECQEFRAAYFTCKRGSLDMRTRIKGQKVY